MRKIPYIMKKILLITVIMLVALGCKAQQALWGFSQTISPEVHPDKTVTFRMYAPNAEKVQVTGDFLPAVQIDTPQGKADVPGIADLVKNADGVWEFTSEVLSPELYSYSFVVDGQKMQDPSNVSQLRDISTITRVSRGGGTHL